MYLITKWFGTFICNKKGIQNKILFPKDENKTQKIIKTQPLVKEIEQVEEKAKEIKKVQKVEPKSQEVKKEKIITQVKKVDEQVTNLWMVLFIVVLVILFLVLILLRKTKFAPRLLTTNRHKYLDGSLYIVLKESSLFDSMSCFETNSSRLDACIDQLSTCSSLSMMGIPISRSFWCRTKMGYLEIS